MKRNILLLLIAGFSVSHLYAQCDLNDPVPFTGEYYVDQPVPGPFGNAFNRPGEPELITLSTGANNNLRDFSAVFLPELDIGQPPADFTIEFRVDCGVTFSQDFSTGLNCDPNIGYYVGPANGGLFDPLDDDSFVMLITENVLFDCNDTTYEIELFFSRDNPLNINETALNPFTFYVGRDQVLHIGSRSELISHVTTFTISGKQVFHNEVNELQFDRDLTDLSSGMYFVQVHGVNGQRQTFKIVQ